MLVPCEELAVFVATVTWLHSPLGGEGGRRAAGMATWLLSLPLTTDWL